MSCQVSAAVCTNAQKHAKNSKIKKDPNGIKNVFRTGEAVPYIYAQLIRLITQLIAHY